MVRSRGVRASGARRHHDDFDAYSHVFPDLPVKRLGAARVYGSSRGGNTNRQVEGAIVEEKEA